VVFQNFVGAWASTSHNLASPLTILQTGRRVRYSGGLNLYKSVSRILTYTFDFQVWRSPTTQSTTSGTPWQVCRVTPTTGAPGRGDRRDYQANSKDITIKTNLLYCKQVGESQFDQVIKFQLQLQWLVVSVLNLTCCQVAPALP
jgi:hypothetical protein